MTSVCMAPRRLHLAIPARVARLPLLIRSMASALPSFRAPCIRVPFQAPGHGNCWAPFTEYRPNDLRMNVEIRKAGKEGLNLF